MEEIGSLSLHESFKGILTKFNIEGLHVLMMSVSYVTTVHKQRLTFARNAHLSTAQVTAFI